MQEWNMMEVKVDYNKELKTVKKVGQVWNNKAYIEGLKPTRNSAEDLR